ncbi:MAG TPA: hypothetical protein VJ456_01565 [Acidimicrobiia bacterium]|nr:hypothetical protein [Acidimicrobiia bacterium]
MAVTELMWRDPPADRRRVLTADIVNQLRAQPGRWAVIRQYPNRTAIKGRTIKHPVDVELRAVKEPPGSALHARVKPQPTIKAKTLF